MANKRVLFLIISVVAAWTVAIICLRPCWAAFSLSVTPYEGGYDLRLGNLGTQETKVIKEITFTITTDIGKQYRVYQRLDKPLTTPDGIEIDRNQFKMYTLTNSNSQGTLELIEEFPVMSGDTVLYTSNTAGDGDSFKVVYTFEPSVSQVPGSYYGRMLYILTPIDSTQDDVTNTLQMYVDLTNEGAVEISTDSGFKTIRISSSDLAKPSGQYPKVFISVKGNLGSRYRLYQELSNAQIKSDSGNLFNLEDITYEAVEDKAGSVVKNGNLSNLKAKALIYSSDDLGSGKDITIEYTPTPDFPKQKADSYSGAINYSIEVENTAAIEPGFLEAVDVELIVEPVFNLTAVSLSEEGKEVSQEGAALLQFGNISYKTDSKESRVRVKIESNLNKPYLVTQKISGPLQNEEGYKIPNELFTFELERPKDTGAKLKVVEEAVIEPEKDTPLFVSNDNGDSDEFEARYKLKVTGSTRGGNYNTGISYSLSEL
jgi:hypothetical protein